MSAIEQRILDTLLELEQAVESMPTANPKPNLMPYFAQLDALSVELPQDADPDLRHYLHRKSYQKARLLLQGRNHDNKRGNCGR